MADDNRSVIADTDIIKYMIEELETILNEAKDEAPLRSKKRGERYTYINQKQELYAFQQ
jgi:hypothetical protein